MTTQLRDKTGRSSSRGVPWGAMRRILLSCAILAGCRCPPWRLPCAHGAKPGFLVVRMRPVTAASRPRDRDGRVHGFVLGSVGSQDEAQVRHPTNWPRGGPAGRPRQISTQRPVRYGRARESRVPWQRLPLPRSGRLLPGGRARIRRLSLRRRGRARQASGLIVRQTGRREILVDGGTSARCRRSG